MTGHTMVNTTTSALSKHHSIPAATSLQSKGTRLPATTATVDKLCVGAATSVIRELSSSGCGNHEVAVRTLDCEGREDRRLLAMAWRKEEPAADAVWPSWTWEAW